MLALKLRPWNTEAGPSRVIGSVIDSGGTVLDCVRSMSEADIDRIKPHVSNKADVVDILAGDYPALAFNPAASIPATAQISSLSEVSPLTPTAPSRTPPS